MASSQSSNKRQATESTPSTTPDPHLISQDRLQSHRSENSPKKFTGQPSDNETGNEASLEDARAEGKDDIDVENRVYIKLMGKKAEFWNHYKAYTTKSKTIRVECMYCQTSYTVDAKGSGTKNIG